MGLSTLWRWIRMEECLILTIKLGLILVLATAMLSVLTISSGTMGRLTMMAGFRVITTLTLAEAFGVPAASSSTSGRPTLLEQSSPITPVTLISLANTDAQGWIVVTTGAMTGTMESVTRTAVTSTPGGWGTRPSMGRAAASL